MKRSRLTRRTPLKPYRDVPKPLKRTPLARQSKRHRKAERDAKPLRDSLKKRFPWCWICGARWKPLTCHEIAKGGLREKSLDKEFALLVACWDCNSGPLEDPTLWPVAKQLACLAVVNPNALDIRAFNLHRGRAADAITMKDVEPYMPDVL